MKKILVSVLLLIAANGLLASSAFLHHGLFVKLFPNKHALTVVDTLTFSQNQLQKSLQFTLHAGLKLTVLTPDISLKVIKKNIAGSDLGMDVEAPEVLARVRQNRYELKPINDGQWPQNIIVQYAGEIFHPIQQLTEEYERGFSTTPGIIDTAGVYLAGSSIWLPQFGEAFITFSLTTEIDSSWDVVSQGKRTTHQIKNGRRLVRWICDKPMEEAFLIAGKFYEYSRKVSNVQVIAFLRSPDEALADKYLGVTGQYLEMYRQLIGPYPFWKFALIENFWETGYGMPSFTLLGPQVIRFPFILHSSYPHELLHNWWGNSVYVDFKSGNWCEGLTAYLADHLIQEQRGRGKGYRRATLQKFTDYVNASNDFPLSKFLSRHDAPSEAIGYGKCLMMWEMLRNDLGDQLFVKGLQHFYQNHVFKRAGFDDLRQSFEQISGKSLKAFFEQWVQRKGAPELFLKRAQLTKHNQTFELSLQIEQIQKEPPFILNLPVAIYFNDEVQIKTVKMTQRTKEAQFIFTKKPLKVEIDPQFQVFRRLHYSEIPPALSKIFGAQKVLIIVPDHLSQESPYQQLAAMWANSKIRDVQVKKAADIKRLPEDRAIWVFGLNNPFLNEIKKGLNHYQARIGQQRVQLEKFDLPLQNNSFVISVRHPQNPRQVMVWLHIGNPGAFKGLARKLPHYSKYSYLAFNGAEPTNIAKGQWPIVNSPLQKMLSDQAVPEAVKLPTRPALAQLAPLFSARRMMDDIKFLASPKLAGRGLGTPGIEQAAQYIAEQFTKAGLQPGADDGGFFQSWTEIVGPNKKQGLVKNIIGLIPGIDPRLKNQAVVVSAHYDHLGRGWPDVHAGDEGKIHPGADDNASGVAVLLELARVLGRSYHPLRTVIFVAFTAEEAGLKGSRYFLKHYHRFPADKIMADLNLDTVGRLNGKKVLILNANSAKEWPFIFMGIGYVTGVQAQMVTQPLDASDQVAFIEAGIPAVQIFSGAHQDYHRPTDTADKIDAQGLVKIATLTREALIYLSSERKEPLTFTEKGSPKTSPSHPSTSSTRKVRTGILPDFTFDGQGVKIQSVAENSPAQKAGLKAGDIIMEFDNKPIQNLRDYSTLLKQHQPGEVIQLTINRNGQIKKMDVTLEER